MSKTNTPLDLVTYCPVTADLVAELEEKHPTLINTDNDSPVFLVSKIPTYRNRETGETLSLVRCRDQAEADLLRGLTSVQVIGECVDGAYVFEDEGEAIYNRVYDQTPVETKGPDGETFTHTPPPMIGVFA